MLTARGTASQPTCTFQPIPSQAHRKNKDPQLPTMLPPCLHQAFQASHMLPMLPTCCSCRMMSEAPQSARFGIIAHVVHLVNRDYLVRQV